MLSNTSKFPYNKQWNRKGNLPNHKKVVSTHVICMYFGVIVLEYYFHESPVSTIDNRCFDHWRSCNWPGGEIKFINSFYFVLISKPDRCARILKRNSTQCRTSFTTNSHWWFVFQDIYLSHIDWSISERALRIRPCTTSCYIPPI